MKSVVFKNKVATCAILTGALSVSAFLISEKDINQKDNTVWLDQAGPAVMAPACGSASISNSTCANASPSVTISWTNDRFYGYEYIRIEIFRASDGARVFETPICGNFNNPCTSPSGEFTWSGGENNTQYDFRVYSQQINSGPQTDHSLSTGSFITPNCGNPFGWHDSSSCDVSTGWVCDPSNLNQPVTVHFYKNGPAGTGTFVDSVIANAVREQAVANLCGGFANHGFSFSTPNSLRTGTDQTIYAYALNVGSGTDNPLLSGSPKTINCAPPLPRQRPGDRGGMGGGGGGNQGTGAGNQGTGTNNGNTETQGQQRQQQQQGQQPGGDSGNQTITSFTALPSSVVSGNPSTLSWQTSGFSACALDQGIGPVEIPNGTRQVFPFSTTTYTLTCSPGNISRQATVTVTPPGRSPLFQEITPSN